MMSFISAIYALWTIFVIFVIVPYLVSMASNIAVIGGLLLLLTTVFMAIVFVYLVVINWSDRK